MFVVHEQDGVAAQLLIEIIPDKIGSTVFMEAVPTGGDVSMIGRERWFSCTAAAVAV